MATRLLYGVDLTAGEIPYVSGSFGNTLLSGAILNYLSDVQITSPTAGKILTYASGSYWCESAYLLAGTAGMTFTFPDYNFAMPSGDKSGYLRNNSGGTSEWVVNPTTGNELLDGIMHTDTVGHTAAQGDIVTCGAFGWDGLAKGTTNAVLTCNASDVLWSTYLHTGTAGGTTNFAVTNTKTLTLTSTGDFNLTVPATGTAALGTGGTSRIAYWSGTNALTSSSTFLYDGSNMAIGTSLDSTKLVNALKYYTDASGTNYGMLFNVQSLRTTAGTQTLYGIRFLLDHNSTYNDTGSYIGLNGNVRNLNTGTLSNASGVFGQVQVSSGAGAGIITNAYGLVSQILESSTTGTIVSAYNLYIYTPTIASGGAITNLYGVYIQAQSGAATNNYSIYGNAGLYRFGDQLAIVGSADRQQLTVTGYSTQAVATALVGFTRNDAAAGVSSMLALTALGSGAANDGGSIDMLGKSSTTAAQSMGQLSWLWATATHASRKARSVWSVWDTAVREGIRIEASGTAPMIGFYGASAVAQQLATTDLGVALSNLGLRVAGTAYPITTSGTVTLSGSVYTTAMQDYDTLPLVDSGAAGSNYIGGFYDLTAASVTLTIGGTVTRTLGTALNAKAARALAVVSGSSSGATVLTVTGVSIDDSGTRNDADSEVLIANCSAVSANAFFQTTKKWLGQITYTLSGGSAGNELSFNYGMVRAKSNNNSNFTLKSLIMFCLGGATDTGINCELIHHKTTGWAYSAAAFTYPTANRIIMLSTDYGTNTRITSGVYINWRRSNLSTAIAGATGGEGYIVRMTTTANNSIRWGYVRMGFATTA